MKIAQQQPLHVVSGHQLAQLGLLADHAGDTATPEWRGGDSTGVEGEGIKRPEVVVGGYWGCREHSEDLGLSQAGRGGGEWEYRTQFHSKLGFANDAALRTACFPTCKESVKCCLFFSLRLFSSLLCSFLYCHPMLWLWFSALSHNASTAFSYFETHLHQC